MPETTQACTRCQSRAARGYLSLHTDAGQLCDCWTSCLQCADTDAPTFTAAGYLVAFLTAPETSAP